MISGFDKLFWIGVVFYLIVGTTGLLLGVFLVSIQEEVSTEVVVQEVVVDQEPFVIEPVKEEPKVVPVVPKPVVEKPKPKVVVSDTVEETSVDTLHVKVKINESDTTKKSEQGLII